MLRFDSSLCLITDRSFCPKADFFPILETAIDSGVTWVQFREKSGLADREMFELGQKVRELTARKGVPMIVNDRLDLAMALDADGIHLGQGDLPLWAAKNFGGRIKYMAYRHRPWNRQKKPSTMEPIIWELARYSPPSAKMTPSWYIIGRLN